MGTLMDPINRRAMDMGVPLSVHIDPTWRCNERCIHCYLDHGEADELSLSELRELLDQMADAGTLFLTLSGREIFLRRDLFAIVEHARLRGFDIKLKTNAILIAEKEAARIAELGVHQVPLERTLRAVGLLRAHCVHVVIACVLMKPNIADFDGVQNLAREVVAEFTIDPTITPHINGDRSIPDLNVDREELRKIFETESLLSEPSPAGTSRPSRWWATWPPSPHRRARVTKIWKIFWMERPAARAIRPATSRPTAMSTRACSLRSPAGT